MKHILEAWEYDYLCHLYELFAFGKRIEYTYKDLLDRMDNAGQQKHLNFQEWLKRYLVELEQHEQYEECSKLNHIIKKLETPL